MSRRNRTSSTWTAICQAEQLPEIAMLPRLVRAEDYQWEYGEYVVLQSGDRCKEGSWVFYETTEQVRDTKFNCIVGQNL